MKLLVILFILNFKVLFVTKGAILGLCKTDCYKWLENFVWSKLQFFPLNLGSIFNILVIYLLTLIWHVLFAEIQFLKLWGSHFLNIVIFESGAVKIAQIFRFKILSDFNLLVQSAPKISG